MINDESFIAILRRIDEIKDELTKLRDAEYTFQTWLYSKFGTTDLQVASSQLRQWRTQSWQYDTLLK